MLAGVWRATIAEPAIAAARRGDRAGALAILSDPASRGFDERSRPSRRCRRPMQAVRDEAVSAVKGTSSTLLFVLIVAAILVIASGVGAARGDAADGDRPGDRSGRAGPLGGAAATTAGRSRRRPARAASAWPGTST